MGSAIRRRPNAFNLLAQLRLLKRMDRDEQGSLEAVLQWLSSGVVTDSCRACSFPLFRHGRKRQPLPKHTPSASKKAKQLAICSATFQTGLSKSWKPWSGPLMQFLAVG